MCLRERRKLSCTYEELAQHCASCSWLSILGSYLLLQRLVERHQQQYRYGRDLDRLEMARDVVWGQREEWRLREVSAVGKTLVHYIIIYTHG